MESIPTLTPVADWPGYYLSEDGRVWSSKTTGCKPRIDGPLKVLSVHLAKSGGYPEVTLKKPGRAMRSPVHKLMLTTYRGPRPEGMECCHGNSVPIDVSIGNLRWGTRSDQYADKILNGTDKKGEKHHNAKLTNGDVIAIRFLSEHGFGNREIAEIFQIHPRTALQIVKRASWKHV